MEMETTDNPAVSVMRFCCQIHGNIGVTNMVADPRVIAVKIKLSFFLECLQLLFFFCKPVSASIPGCTTSFTSSPSKSHALNIVLLAYPQECVCLWSLADGRR